MITPAAMRFCLMREIPITMLSNTGEYYGRIEADDRLFVCAGAHAGAAHVDSGFVLSAAQAIVRGKIENTVDLLQPHESPTGLS